MFWKKPEEEKAITCKGCGIEISEGNAVLDVDTGSFVCKDCKRLGFEAKKMADENSEDGYDEIKAKAETPQDIEKQEDQRMSLKCRKCGYMIPYSKAKGKPGSCGYCGTRLS